MNNIIRNFFRSTIAIGLLAGTLTNAAAPTRKIEPFTAIYQASAWGITAQGLMSLVALDGNRWQYSLNVSNALGELNQQTVFDVQGNWLRPLSSNDSRRVLVKRMSIETQYDWKKHEARWSGDINADRTGPVALQDGDMDALLINLAVVHDLGAGRVANYRLLGNGKAQTLDYQLAGEEDITVAGKTYTATKVIHTDDKRQTIVWAVPQIPIPARILQRDNGKDTIDLQIKSWQ
jgi:hypothetical protein